MLEPSFVFVIHAKNDLDHFLPLLIELNKRNYSVIVFTFGCLAFANDERFNLLKSKSINILFLENLFLKSKLISKLSFVSNKFYKLSTKLFLKKFDDKLFRTILKSQDIEPKNSAFFIDFDQNQSVLKVLKIANEIFGKTNVLPHSVSNWKNKLVKNSDFKIPAYNTGHITKVDNLFLADKGQVETISPFYRYKNLSVMGTPRFSKEWVSHLYSNLPKQSSAKFKILLLMSKSHMNYNIQEIERIISTITMMPNVELVVQLHTRGNTGKVKIDKKAIIAPESRTTVQLISDANLVLFTATTVVLDCILINKPAIYLRRTNSNEIYFSDYITNWACDTRDDIILKINMAKSSKLEFSTNERNDCLEFFNCNRFDEFINAIINLNKIKKKVL